MTTRAFSNIHCEFIVNCTVEELLVTSVVLIAPPSDSSKNCPPHLLRRCASAPAATLRQCRVGAWLDLRPAATGDRRPATGDRRPATGDRRPATGDYHRWFGGRGIQNGVGEGTRQVLEP